MDQEAKKETCCQAEDAAEQEQRQGKIFLDRFCPKAGKKGESNPQICDSKSKFCRPWRFSPIRQRERGQKEEQKDNL